MTEVRTATWLQDMALAYPTESIRLSQPFLSNLSDDIADAREPEHRYVANS